MARHRDGRWPLCSIRAMGLDIAINAKPQVADAPAAKGWAFHPEGRKNIARFRNSFPPGFMDIPMRWAVLAGTLKPGQNTRRAPVSFMTGDAAG
jgi:hypothetical protein